MHLILLAIAYWDMKEKRIADELSWLLLLCFLLEDPGGFFQGLGVFLFLSLVYFFLDKVFHKEPLGYGDVKLFGVLSVGLGQDYLSFIFLSFLLAGVWGFLLVLTGSKKEDSFPLAPLMILSFLYYK